MKKLFWVGTLFVLLLSACAPVSPPTPQVDGVSTMVAGTMQALTAAAPPSTAVPPTQTPPGGTSVSLNGLSFFIPIGVASGAQVVPQEAVPPASDMPWWGIHPAYNEYPLQGYTLTGTFHDPKIYVYPVDEYVQMDESIASIVQSLRDTLGAASLPQLDRMPFLPAFNAGQVFYSNAQKIQFQNGMGIRYITQYDQAFLPINNHELFYTFQGLTNDGKYYVAVILPINAPFLVPEGGPTSITPADGVQFDWTNYDAMPAYIQAVTQKLNAADPNGFNPGLPTLDALIQSITIVP